MIATEGNRYPTPLGPGLSAMFEPAEEGYAGGPGPLLFSLQGTDESSKAGRGYAEVARTKYTGSQLSENRHLRKLSFRELGEPEAHFPRMPLTGDSVNKGARVLSGTPNPFVVCDLSQLVLIAFSRSGHGWVVG